MADGGSFRLAYTKKKLDWWEPLTGFFSMMAFLCMPKKMLPLRKVPTPSARPRCASIYAERHGKGAEKTQPVHFHALLWKICEPLQVRKRTGFGETTFPAGASPNVRNDWLRTAKWGA